MATSSLFFLTSSSHHHQFVHISKPILNVLLLQLQGRAASKLSAAASSPLKGHNHQQQQQQYYHTTGKNITLYNNNKIGKKQLHQQQICLHSSSSLAAASTYSTRPFRNFLSNNNSEDNQQQHSHTDTSGIPLHFPSSVDDPTTPAKPKLKFVSHTTAAMDRAPSAQKQSLLELYRPEPTVPMARCHALLRENGLNKGMAFSPEERLYLGLEGLMPSVCTSQDEQASFEINHLREQPNPMARFRYLEALKERNEKLFYRIMRDYPAELLPIVYTPTVGDACLQFEYRYPKALFISIDKDNSVSRIHQLLCNWKQQEVCAIVVTDGERILGLGDLGVQGVEIPVGKLALYVAMGGVQPSWCLPIQLDVGTDNEKFLANPNYAGLRQKRVRGVEYERFIDNFMKACRKKYGQNVLIQFEDFGKNTAYDLLKRYQNNYCTFNDDIQGTASVSMAGLIAATRITGQKVSDMKILFHGAGTAAIGVAKLIVEKMLSEGLTHEEACARIFMVKTDGLMIKKRTNLSAQQKPFAKDGPDLKDLYEVVKAVKPTAIIGVSTIFGAFSAPIIQAMASFNKRPLIFALSNPTSKSECTAEEAYKGTNGAALFASGSPFPFVKMPDGRTFQPGQCNNAYIFPGVALGVLLFKVANIPDKLFLIAATKLAESVTKEELALGCLYPALEKVPEISIKIAVAIGEHCYKDGSAKLYPEPEDKELFVRSQVYRTNYEQMLPVVKEKFASLNANQNACNETATATTTPNSH